jgi:hypothetical protein
MYVCHLPYDEIMDMDSDVFAEFYQYIAEKKPPGTPDTTVKPLKQSQRDMITHYRKQHKKI